LSEDQDTIYVIDPDPAISEAIAALLGTYNLQVKTFREAESFLAFRRTTDLAGGCLVIELNLPGLNGLALLRQLREEGTEVPIIVLTNAHEPVIHRQAVQFGADRVVEKPLINDMLTYTVMNVLPNARSGLLKNGTR